MLGKLSESILDKFSMDFLRNQGDRFKFCVNSKNRYKIR